jgi:hypothetical protein
MDTRRQSPTPACAAAPIVFPLSVQPREYFSGTTSAEEFREPTSVPYITNFRVAPRTARVLFNSAIYQFEYDARAGGRSPRSLVDDKEKVTRWLEAVEGWWWAMNDTEEEPEADPSKPQPVQS